VNHFHTALLCTAILFACSSESSLSRNPADTGVFRLDGGVLASGADGGLAGSLGDAGSPAEMQCDWPSPPTVCDLSIVDEPMFSLPDRQITDALNRIIHCADKSIRAALYQTSWEAVVQAVAARLENAPNLKVELVIDDSQCPRIGGVLQCPWAKLEADPRVTIVDDSRTKLMHHKFIIRDESQVWVGSANMTTNSLCNDVNDAVVIDEPEIVAAYNSKFEEYFSARKFGPTQPIEPAKAGPYTVYFGPVSPLSQPAPWFEAMIAAIDVAETSVEFMIYAFTREEVSDALLRAKSRGVKVQGLVSSLYANDAPALSLVAGGVEVRKGRIHSKMMVIDKELVITGSANWSKNAWQNNENSLWISETDVANQYSKEFSRVFAKMRPIE